MASEESKLINQPTNDNPDTDTKEQETSQATPPAPAKEPAPMMAADNDDDDEPRSSGDVDFGQLLATNENQIISTSEPNSRFTCHATAALAGTVVAVTFPSVISPAS